MVWDLTTSKESDLDLMADTIGMVGGLKVGIVPVLLLLGLPLGVGSILTLFCLGEGGLPRDINFRTLGDDLLSVPVSGMLWMLIILGLVVLLAPIDLSLEPLFP